ncbi:phage terminase, large subunit, PBSX family [Salinibacillus kushneri]|uniref:Phage terminase, large subunit, PBSX family n=1 Tax=Salinibacillus kushneri TaxID=237682 RepID=A0A1I0IDD3_9BACI|nr:PBSX family phage terminase large subunit [Salinibacillus kushneri]SET94925.1 phage terminase, large subunit, PBSX family [Salinibacillus kushneri]
MKNKRNAVFKWKPFSKKQKKLIMWWMKESPYYDYDGVIAQGSIRSGKTVAMVDSFVMWSLETFDGENFIMAGKTMGALKRNVLEPMFKILNAKGIPYNYIRSDDPRVEIGNNTYYLFGGNNEQSQDTVQGLTAAGAFLDEVALMPESFVTQVEGRCSVDGAKYFYNCNPKGPYHWFKENYIDKAKEKLLLDLHFKLDDNLSLSERVKERLKRIKTGVFYKRDIEGLWVVAEGIIYEMFDHDKHVVKKNDKLPAIRKYWVACDYGTSNATTFILHGLGADGRLYILDEYYHSGAKERKKSPSKYAKDFKEWISKHKIMPERIFIDPSAEGFILELYAVLSPRLKSRIQASDNEVKRGIELVSSIIDNDLLRVHERCANVLKEITAYAWDEKAAERGEDKPIKANDHCMDPIRYTANGTRMIWQGKGIA